MIKQHRLSVQFAADHMLATECKVNATFASSAVALAIAAKQSVKEGGAAMQGEEEEGDLRQRQQHEQPEEQEQEQEDEAEEAPTVRMRRSSASSSTRADGSSRGMLASTPGRRFSKRMSICSEQTAVEHEVHRQRLMETKFLSNVRNKFAFIAEGGVSADIKDLRDGVVPISDAAQHYLGPRRNTFTSDLTKRRRELKKLKDQEISSAFSSTTAPAATSATSATSATASRQPLWQRNTSSDSASTFKRDASDTSESAATSASASNTTSLQAAKRSRRDSSTVPSLNDGGENSSDNVENTENSNNDENNFSKIFSSTIRTNARKRPMSYAGPLRSSPRFSSLRTAHLSVQNPTADISLDNSSEDPSDTSAVTSSVLHSSTHVSITSAALRARNHFTKTSIPESPAINEDIFALKSSSRLQRGGSFSVSVSKNRQDDLLADDPDMPAIVLRCSPRIRSHTACASDIAAARRAAVTGRKTMLNRSSNDKVEEVGSRDCTKEQYLEVSDDAVPDVGDAVPAVEAEAAAALSTTSTAEVFPLGKTAKQKKSRWLFTRKQRTASPK